MVILKLTQVMVSPPPTTVSHPASADQLPPEALALATRLFDAARNGQMDILEQALRGGLKPNMTNGKGDSLVSSYVFLYFEFVASASMPLASSRIQRMICKR